VRAHGGYHCGPLFTVRTRTGNNNFGCARYRACARGITLCLKLSNDMGWLTFMKIVSYKDWDFLGNPQNSGPKFCNPPNGSSKLTERRYHYKRSHYITVGLLQLGLGLGTLTPTLM